MKSLKPAGSVRKNRTMGARVMKEKKPEVLRIQNEIRLIYKEVEELAKTAGSTKEDGSKSFLYNFTEGKVKGDPLREQIDKKMEEIRKLNEKIILFN